MLTTAPRAVIYCRISLDATGQGLGVQRQEEECRELCQRKGWDVVEVIVDNSVSASTGRRRPGWDRVLGMIGSHAVDVVVAWHVDRMYRQMADLEDLVKLTEGTGVTLATVTGEIDLATTPGRLVARLLASVARAEVESKSDRQKASHRQRVSRGKPWWTTRPFGYERNGDIREDEATLVREAYSAVLRGDSVYSIAARWNDSGILAPRGRAWRSTNLRHVLMHPRNAGIHTYQGEPTGQPATWDGIVSEDVYRAAVRILSDPARHVGGGGRRAGLLTGIAVCGKCGGRVLQGQSKATKDGQRRRLYVCRDGRCVTYPADFVDGRVLREMVRVSDLWADRLDTSDSASDVERRAELDALRAEEMALTGRKGDLAEMFADGLIDRMALTSGTEKANARIAEIQARMAEMARGQGGYVDAELIYQSLDEMLESGQDEQLRTMVREMCQTIELMPRGRGARTLDSAQVRITWNA